MKRRTVEEAATAYVVARNERKAAKAKLLRWMNDNSDGGESYPCLEGENKHEACFNHTVWDQPKARYVPKPVEQRCDLCKEREPLYQAYKDAVRKQQATLRALDRVVNRALNTPKETT